MKVSLVIPFYRGNKYLKQIDQMASLNAKNMLSGDTLELVLVNDSPFERIDMTEFQLGGYELKVVTNEANSGIHKSRVNGLNKATGDYILMLDQDDIIMENCIVSHLCNIGTADISVSNGYKRNGACDIAIYGSSKRQEKINKLFWYIYLENRILSPGQCLIRKSVIPQVWMTDIMNKNGSDDMLLWIYMLEQKCVFVPNRDYLYVHVSTGENVSNDDMKMAGSTYEMLDIMDKNKTCSRFMRWMLKRKIDNDVYYVQHGKDKYFDYQCIEALRKLLSRTRV